MLSKKHRLPLRTELNRVKATGKLVHGRLFSLLLSKQPMSTSEVARPARQRLRRKALAGGRDSSEVNEKPSRFAFIISSKVHKKAVKRNRAKRLLSEAVYSLIPEIKPGFDGVFLVKKAIVGKELTEIKKEVEEIFRKGKLSLTR